MTKRKRASDTLRIEYWPLEKCLTKKWKRNQKRHDMGAIMQSIQRYGFKDPLHYDETLDGFDEGNGRTDAVQAIQSGGHDAPRGIRVDAQGSWFVPVGLGVDAVTVAEAEAYAIDHNNTTLMGGDFDLTDLMRQWDDGLTDVLKDLAHQDALPVSTDAEDLDRLLAMTNGHDAPEDAEARVSEAEALQEVWQVKTGDMWQLGNHKLICGDCTDPAVVERVMDGERAVLGVTDPPYGVNYDPQWRVESHVTRRSHGTKIQNDNMADWRESYELIPADVVYVWHASWYSSDVHDGLASVGFEPIYLIVWSKDLAVLGRGDYHWKHELCWYAVRKGKSHNWQGARDQKTVWDIPTIHSFANGKDVEEWGIVGHGNQKPLECMERPIINNSSIGQIVFDPFVGSGTTIIAAERLGRKCRAIEISEAYSAVTLQRFLDTTGVRPERLRSGVRRGA